MKFYVMVQVCMCVNDMQLIKEKRERKTSNTKRNGAMGGKSNR